MEISSKKETKTIPIKNSWRKVISAKTIISNKKLINHQPKGTLKLQINSENKKKRPASSYYTKNVNAYLYLYSVKNQETNELNDWVLNLRSDNTKLNNHINKTALAEPSFYQQDLENYLKKKKIETKLKKSKSVISRNKYPTLSQYLFLFKKTSDGTPLTQDLLNFELNLRTPKKCVKILHKWNSSCNIKKNNFTSIDYPVNLKKGIKEKYIMRPYSVTIKKVEYNGNNIIKKKCQKDFTKAYEKFGEHYSQGPYNDKYDEKNYYVVESLIGNNAKNQSSTWYNLGLRNLRIGKDKKGNSSNDKIHKKKWRQ